MPKKILIADDEESILRIVSFRLEKKGYEIIKATNGKEALDLMRENKPDLVLLDLAMPVMDGYEVCKAIKTDEALKNIPVIFLTVSREEKVKERADRYCADGYIMKPFDSEDLEKKVKKFIS